MVLLLALVWAGRPVAMAAQQWDTPAATELVARAVLRRDRAEASDGLPRWDAVARGVVLFLTQVGGANAAPQLVKADELAVEVYWEAPGRSKQTILAWRDQTFLPTDIQYHRDHLGIVANDFGPMIRIGEGDEVRDVPHPLSAQGMSTYHFALVDSLTVATGDREWQVYALLVRPRDPTASGVVGTLFLDRGSAALVRFQFSFTPAAYRETLLEDITVVLENALHHGGSWLPWRQEIEIRRRSSVVDLPIRGIIRGRWELTDHRLGEDAPVQAAGMGIGGLRGPGGGSEYWDGTLAERIRAVVGPAGLGDLEELRHQVHQWLGNRRVHVGPPIRPAFGAISELARFNRVEGLRLGIGATMRLPLVNATLSPWVGVGLANHRTTGRVDLSLPTGSRGEMHLRYERLVVDAGQSPVISPLLNSLLAQEFGRDRGDWVERDRVGVEWTRQGDHGMAGAFGVAGVRYRPATGAARPAHGGFRPNPYFERARELVVHAQVGRAAPPGPGGALRWSLGAEVGTGSPAYLRFDGQFDVRWLAGPGELRASAAAGWGSGALPAARGFVLGGWGTLPGVPFRVLAGRRYALTRLEWLGQVRTGGLSLGSFTAIDLGLWVGPFLAYGAAGGELLGGEWPGAAGADPVMGLAVEGLFRSLRMELGYAWRSRGLGLSGDLATSWWSIL